MSAESADDNDRLAQVVMRNAFYRDGYTTLRRIAFAEALAIILLFAALIISVFFVKPDQQYFATSEDGRIIPLVPVNQPLPEADVLAWVMESATETMTFGFHDFDYRLNESMRHFTVQGRQSFYNALSQSGRLDAMQARNQVIKASLDGVIQIPDRGIDRQSGRYIWRIEAGLSLDITSFEGGRRNSRLETLLLELIVVRVSTLESPSGLRIQQWVAAPR